VSDSVWFFSSIVGAPLNERTSAFVAVSRVVSLSAEVTSMPEPRSSSTYTAWIPASSSDCL